MEVLGERLGNDLLKQEKRSNHIMKLTEKEAYQAMFMFLEHFYSTTDSDELGWMLGSMSFLEDGSTADSAMWEIWLESIDKMKQSDDDAFLLKLNKE